VTSLLSSFSAAGGDEHHANFSETAGAEHRPDWMMVGVGRAASEARRGSSPALVECTALAVLAIVALGLMNT
jgi:hypothetical protein